MTSTSQYSCRSLFLISSYGVPLAQTASYLALHSTLFGADGVIIITFYVYCHQQH